VICDTAVGPLERDAISKHLALALIPLPLSLLAAISLLALTYLVLVQTVKTWFYRRHALL